MSKGNNARTYAVGLRLTMLQIYLYQYWTTVKLNQKGGRLLDHVSNSIIFSTTNKKMEGRVLKVADFRSFNIKTSTKTTFETQKEDFLVYIQCISIENLVLF